MPEPNGVPKLTPRDGCGPGIKKKKMGGKKKQICLTLSRLKILYEIIFKMNSDYF